MILCERICKTKTSKQNKQVIFKRASYTKYSAFGIQHMAHNINIFGSFIFIFRKYNILADISEVYKRLSYRKLKFDGVMLTSLTCSFSKISHILRLQLNVPKTISSIDAIKYCKALFQFWVSINNNDKKISVIDMDAVKYK